jgi:hypothetical protein
VFVSRAPQADIERVKARMGWHMPSYTITDALPREQQKQSPKLPQPVIAQLVSRTWTQGGWMYTRAQLQSATEIAELFGRPVARSATS